VGKYLLYAPEEREDVGGEGIFQLFGREVRDLFDGVLRAGVKQSPSLSPAKGPTSPSTICRPNSPMPLRSARCSTAKEAA